MSKFKFFFIFGATFLLSSCGRSDKLENNSLQSPLLKSSIQGEFSYSDEKGAMGGGIEIKPLANPSEFSKYKAIFNGYIQLQDSVNACELEGDLVEVTSNVFSLKSKADDVDQKFNLILVLEQDSLIIHSTDEIEGCGMNAQVSVPGVYKRVKNKST